MSLAKPLVLCLSFVLAPAGEALAQNLLLNSEFDAGDGLADWFSVAGAWSLGDDVARCALSGSAAGTSAEVGGTHRLGALSEQCVLVDPSLTPTLWLGGWFQTTGQVFPRLYLEFSSDTTCGSNIGFSGPVFSTGPAAWTPVLGEVAVSPSAQSVRLWAEFNPQIVGIPAFTGSWDRLYVGTAGESFADGFEPESGSTCRWWNAVGEI